MDHRVLLYLVIISLGVCSRGNAQTTFDPKNRGSSGNGLPFESEMFRIRRTSPVSLGEKAVFSCQLADGQELEDEPCYFLRPDGVWLQYTPLEGEQSNVTTENGDVVDGILGSQLSDFNNFCELTAESMREEFFGEWHCALHGNHNVKHLGVFHLFETQGDLYVKDVRLPRHVVPESYHIFLHPDLSGEFRVKGNLNLEFKVVEDKENHLQDSDLYKKVYLHSLDTSINEMAVAVYAESGTEIKVVGHEYDLDRQFYVIHLDTEMPMETTVFLNVSFTSYLNDYNIGFYRSSYFDQESKSLKYLAVTQFESHFARRSFPCLDEPDRKATFEIQLRHKNVYNARSNMETISTENIEDDVITSFNRSVKMSPYLVAFLVSDFDYTVDTENSNYKIWHQTSKKGQAEVAATNGAKILNFYEAFFGIKYPLPKTDMAAIPDFSFGAMENWGLITYQESFLLFVNGVSDEFDREFINVLMAHELAHQWFGNLVTMKWWSDLWLNEGFATYAMYHAIENVFPETFARKRMIIDDVQFVFKEDSFESSAALSYEVENPDFDALFGAITYNKGSAVLRMAENFLTLETFTRGVKNYLEKFSYQNADRDDLWLALTEAAQEDGHLPAGLSAQTIMNTWTLQAGYPVLQVEGIDQMNALLTQKRFLMNSKSSYPNNEKWIIPISIAYPKAESTGFNVTTPSSWMLPNNTNFIVKLDHLPYVINVQETGYYRVRYDNDNWEALLKLLETEHLLIHELNRGQILDDALNLARAQKLDYQIALDLTKYLREERDYVPWQSALRSLVHIDAMLNDETDPPSEAYLNFQTYMKSLLAPIYQELGFEPLEGDGHLTRMTRKSVLTWLCLYNNQDCVSKSLELFTKWMSTPEENPIHPDIRGVVYTSAIRHGDATHWNFLWSRFVEEKFDSERDKILSALGAPSNPDLVGKYLEETLTDKVRINDALTAFLGIGAHSPGKRIMFIWLQDNWERIKDRFGERFADTIVTMTAGHTDSIHNEADVVEFTAFLESKLPDLETAALALTGQLEVAEANLVWSEESRSSVTSWLEDAVVEPTTSTFRPSTTTLTSTTEMATTTTVQTTVTTSSATQVQIYFGWVLTFVLVYETSSR